MTKRHGNRATFLLSWTAALMFFSNPAAGQSLRWIRQFGSTAPLTDRAAGVATDGTGNVYVVGFTLGSLSGQTNAGDSDAFIRKYDSSGNLLWSRQFGTAGGDFASAATADASGVYVAGTTSGALGGQTAGGLSDGFLTRFDGNGNVVWTRLIGGVDIENGYAVASDGSGVYVCGDTSGLIPGQTAAGSSDAWVRKFDASGNVQWTRQFGTTAADGCKSVAVSGGSVYAAGTTNGALGPGASGGSPDVFVRLFDTAGNTVWTRQLGTSGAEAGEAVAADASGVYVTGSTNGALSGSFLGGALDAFLRKYDTAGNVLWTRQIGTSGIDSGNGLAVDGTGVYLSGLTGGVLPGQSSSGNQDGFVAKYDSAGNSIWTTQYGSAAEDTGRLAAVDANGVYAAGYTLGTFAGQTTAGLDDGYIASFTLGGGGTGGGGSGLRFIPVTPCRVGDTRLSGGVLGSPSFDANTTRDVAIPASACGIPASARAYSLNITVVPIEPLAFLSAWPAGQTRPQVSTLNSFHGGVVANAAIVPAGTNGAISIFVTNRTDVVVDINGYFDLTTAAGSYAFFTTSPCRLADTRASGGFTGSFGPPQLVANAIRNFPVPSGACSVPQAGAYSLNATVVPPAPLGFLTLWAAGGARPLVSTLNSFDSAIVSNAAIVPANGGQISTFVTQNTDLVMDLNGYFGTPGIVGELYFTPLTPCRLADTRLAGQGAPIMAAQETRNFTVAGACGVPADARAFSVNITVVPPGPMAFLTLFPAGQSRPFVSLLNSLLGRVVANAALVPAGNSGQVSVYVTDQTHVIIDINGYFR